MTGGTTVMPITFVRVIEIKIPISRLPHIAFRVQLSAVQRSALSSRRGVVVSEDATLSSVCSPTGIGVGEVQR